MGEPYLLSQKVKTTRPTFSCLLVPSCHFFEIGDKSETLYPMSIAPRYSVLLTCSLFFHLEASGLEGLGVFWEHRVSDTPPPPVCDVSLFFFSPNNPPRFPFIVVPVLAPSEYWLRPGCAYWVSGRLGTRFRMVPEKPPNLTPFRRTSAAPRTSVTTPFY